MCKTKGLTCDGVISWQREILRKLKDGKVLAHAGVEDLWVVRAAWVVPEISARYARQAERQGVGATRQLATFYGGVHPGSKHDLVA